MRTISPSVVAGLFLLVAPGCDKPPAVAPAPPAAAAPAAPPAPPVAVKPERKTLVQRVEQPGQIEAFEETPLFVKVAGFVKKVHVDIGDSVREGQLLAELAVPEMEEEHKQKQALVAQAEAEVEQADAAVLAARASYETAKALVLEAEAGRSRGRATFERWQSEYRRVQELVTRKVLDEQTRDETLNQMRSAEAAQEEIEAKVTSATAARSESAAKRDKAAADVRAAAARVQVAQADQRRVAALLGYARVTAPFDGVVTRRHVDTGHFLQPAGGGKADPVFVVTRRDPLRVFISVPEQEAVWVRPGAAATIRVPARPGLTLPGKVVRTSWSLDPKARTLRAEIDLPNANEQLRPGMYVYGTVHAEHPGAWAVPATAVAGQGDQTYCFRVVDGKAVRTPVQVGVRDGASVEVVKKQAKPVKPGDPPTWEDLTGTEELLSGNLTGITDGQAVAR